MADRVITTPVLRPYQVQAIEKARAEIVAKKRAILLVAFCGAGKTVIASEIIRSANARGSRTLFLAHRRELIFQTRDKLRSFGVEPGIIMGSEKTDLSAACQVASVQTLAQRKGVLDKVDLIFFDEAHHAAAKSYSDIAAQFPRARVVGLTATPWRQDGKGLADIFDSHVVVATPKELAEQGYLCPVGGWQFQSIATDDGEVRGGDYVQSTLDAAGRDVKLLGSIVGEYVSRAMGKSAVCFCVSVAASQETAAAFRAAGVAAEHLDGETPKEQRDAMLNRLRSGQTQVVCNCAVLTEGTDIPSLEVCILASPTLSPGLYLQRVGRVLRPSPGKQMAIIHDHCRAIATHGHPYDDRDYAPSEADPDRSVNAKRKDANKELKLCKSCGAVRFRSTCGVCGVSPSAREVAEELRVQAVEIRERERGPEIKALAEKFRAMSEEEKFEMFKAIVAKYGNETNRSLGVFRHLSGDSAWPPRRWKLQLGFHVNSFRNNNRGGNR
jgi:DNA repair protein RadD